jgi:hypothetical protein
VLLGLDMTKTPRNNGIKRTDNDFAVSWVKNFGRGRVFYCSLGHREDIYWNPQVLRHYLAGIQFAMGDLKADTTPLPQPGEAVAEVNDTIMGEYAEPQTHIIGIAAPTTVMFPPTVNSARVIAEGKDNYRAVLMLKAATTDAQPQRIEMTGKLEDNKLNLTGKAGDVDWIGIAMTDVPVKNAQGLVVGGNRVEGIGTGPGRNYLVFHPANDTTKKITLPKSLRRSPTEGARPPANALVLLPYVPGSLTNLEQLTNTNWAVMEDGSMMVRNGENKSKKDLGDMQLHIEWMTPYMPEARGQGRGNSGVYLQNRYEVQVLDSFGLDRRTTMRAASTKWRSRA